MKKKLDEISIENLSHFIKTPLVIITGYCDIINDGILGEINPEQKEYIDKIKKEVLKVDGFLNNFIDHVEKSFREELDVKKERDIVEILKEIFLIIYSQADKNEIFPDFIIPDHPVMIYIDEQWDKAFMLILREFIKCMNKKQFLKLKLDTEESKILIYADKGDFIRNLNEIESSFLFITGKTMLEASNFNVDLETDRIIISYE